MICSKPASKVGNRRRKFTGRRHSSTHLKVAPRHVIDDRTLKTNKVRQIIRKNPVHLRVDLDFELWEGEEVNSQTLSRIVSRHIAANRKADFFIVRLGCSQELMNQLRGKGIQIRSLMKSVGHSLNVNIVGAKVVVNDVDRFGNLSSSTSAAGIVTTPQLHKALDTFYTNHPL